MPEEKTDVNLVSKIPKKKQKEIALEIVTQYDIDKRARSDWEDKRNTWYKLWLCHRDAKSEPWEGASNVCIPWLAMAANQFHSRSYQTIFTAHELVMGIPMGSADIQRAHNVEKYMDWQLRYETEDYEDEFDKLLQLLPINGIAFKKTRPGKDGTIISENISPLDLVLPYGTKKLNDARRIVHRLWLYYNDLKKRSDSGFYANFDNIDSEEGGEQDDSELQDTVDEVTGIIHELGDEKPHLTLECHKEYNLGDGVKPYIFTVHRDTNTIFRVTSREIKKKTLHYFTDYHFLPNPAGFYSFGFGHFLEPLNEMANTAFNQIFDSGSMTNMPFGFYTRRAGFKKKKIKIHPGMFEEVEDADAITFPKLQRVDMVLPSIIGMIQQYVENFTSTSDYMMGRESKGTKTPTAHGTLAIIEQGLVTFGTMTKRIFRSFHKELRQIMILNSLFLPDTKEYRVMEDIENIPFPKIKRAEFDKVYDVVPVGDPTFASRNVRRQEAVEIYQMAMSNPLVVGNPELGMPPNPRGMWQVTKDLLQAYDRHDWNKILPPFPEVPISPEEENARMAQGDYVAPKPGEDVNAHVAAHTGFMKSEFYRSLPSDYQKLFVKHMEETRAVAYLTQMARARLTGGENAQGQADTGGMGELAGVAGNP